MILVRTNSAKASSETATAQTELIQLLMQAKGFDPIPGRSSSRVSLGRYVESMLPLRDEIEDDDAAMGRLFDLMRNSFPNSKVIVGTRETL